MATAELVIAFDARADKLEASLKRVTTKLNELENVVGRTGSQIEQNTGLMARAFDRATTNLTRFAIAYAGLRGAQVITDIAVKVDDLNQSLLRLQVLTNSSVGEAASQFSRLAAVASTTGQPISAVTDQFTRFFNATTSLGASRREVEQFVKVLGDFGRVSTGGPQEIGAAITQLAQGLASGRLQGDELKSIMENMPVLAQAIARELGVSQGELRKMGEEGRLVAENVFPAIVRAGADLASRLEGVPLSLRQSFQTFANAGLVAVARLDAAIGASEFLAGIFRGAASGLDRTSRRALGTGVEVPAELRLQNLNEEATATVRRLNEIDSQLRRTEQVTIEQAQRFANIRNEAARQRAIEANVAQRTGVDVARLNAEKAELEARYSQQRGVIRNAEQQLAEEQRIAAEQRQREGRDQRIGEADARARAIAEQANPLARAIRQRDDRLRDLETTLADRRARDVDGRNAAEIARFEAQQRAAIAAIYRRAEETAGAEGRADAQRAQRAQERQDREDRERALREARERRTALEVIRGADRGTTRDIDNILERLTSPAVGSTVGSPIQVALQQGIQLQEIFGALETQVTATGTAVQRAGGDMSVVLDAARRNAEALRDALIDERPQDAGIIGERTQESIARMEQSLNRVASKAKDTWNAIGAQGAQAFSQDLAGGIIDFVDTGIQKFDELAANFLKNIAKMILQMMILNGLKAGLGPGGLGLLTFRANGGPVSSGSPYVIGERGPELFVPTGSGYIVPNHSMPSVAGSGGGTTVNVYNQASGTTTRQQERNNGLGGKEIDIYIEQIVQRGISSGRFDAAMGQSFGASRAGRI
jgi:tape measure domain-containing protein